MLSRAADLPADFDDLLSTDAVDELIAQRGVRKPFIRMAKDGELLAGERYLSSAGFGADMPDQIDSAKVLAEFAAGTTIVLQGLHRLWPPVIDFVAAMVADLGHPVQANAYITPASNRGFDPHYDVHDVFVLQTAGRKHWVVYEPVFVDPLPGQSWSTHRQAIEERSREEPVIDAVLEPGDALYLPRGWIHAAQALGETSIHLTVGVSPVTVHDAVRALIDELADSPQMRASLPMGVDFAASAQIRPIAEKALAAALDVVGSSSSDYASAVADRLTWRHADRTRPVAVRPLSTVAQLSSITSDTVVGWRGGLVGELCEHDGVVDLRLREKTITFPESCARALDWLHAGHRGAAGSLPGLDSADGVVLARRLLREAVVVISESQRAPSDPAHVGESGRPE
ncbi:hypothetical protein GCM10027169_32450 [Gordonia jinhuaensis]|uniref:JmjC domain-containing protein n=1 Tax=Gordonia jinhuaensis TaxID=1517702 RepID=A0A916T656_9ACTN|nr:hypothetical protein GCM10011489_21590 [Gordonia jinhuaensis]